jgi:hypothetical protein
VACLKRVLALLIVMFISAVSNVGCGQRVRVEGDYFVREKTYREGKLERKIVIKLPREIEKIVVYKNGQEREFLPDDKKFRILRERAEEIFYGYFTVIKTLESFRFIKGHIKVGNTVVVVYYKKGPIFERGQIKPTPQRNTPRVLVIILASKKLPEEFGESDIEPDEDKFKETFFYNGEWKKGSWFSVLNSDQSEEKLKEAITTIWPDK